MNYDHGGEHIHRINNVFVFDLHNVLFKRNYPEMIKQALKVPKKIRLLQMALNPFFIYHALKLLTQTRVTEDYIIRLATKYPAMHNYLECALTITNAQQPIEETLTIIKKLKNRGCKIYLLSNIGEHGFAQLKKRHETVFNYFDGIQVTTAEDNWLQKPAPEAFKKFLSRFNIEPTSMIFIDDNFKNIKSAQNLGITTVHFKSSQQLLKQLIIC